MSPLVLTSRTRMLVAVLVLSASYAVCQPAYDAYVVEPWDDSYDLATSFMPDINELNTAVGTANISGGTTAHFLWTEVGGKQEADIGQFEINNLGVTASNSAVYWAPGDHVMIPTPEPIGSPAITDLNNLNVVVGNAAALGKSRALVWDQENGSRWLADHGLPDSTSYAYAINDAGRVAGAHHIPFQSTDERAFVFDLDTQEYFGLHAMLNPSGEGITRAVDVAENGVVVGEGSKEAYGGGIAGFIWSEADGFTFMLGLDGGEARRVHPRSVNSTRTAVGRALDGQNEWRAFIWNQAYGIRDLEELATLPAGFNLQEALVINENGWIVALGFWGDVWGPLRAVVFVPQEQTTPVEEPILAATRVSLRARGPVGHGGARLSFTLPVASDATLRIHDLRGRRVAELTTGNRPAGTHEVAWDGRHADGRRAAAGVYLALLDTGSARASTKVVVVR